MTAIFTKFLPSSNCRPSRIKATAGNGAGSLTISVGRLEDELLKKGLMRLHGEEIHALAAQKLASRFKWKGKLIGGEVPKGMAFVFAD